MNISQLKYFQAITRNKTFLDAAEEMNISQSSLSKQLSSLESEIGVALFDRSGRRTKLTEAGEIFAKDVDLLLNQYKAMLLHVVPYRDYNTLHIGSLALLGQYGLNYKLAEFMNSNDKYRLVVEDVEEDILINGFRDGKYDLIIGRTLPPDIEVKESIKIADDELVAVMRNSHPLAERDFIEFQEIMSTPLFLTKAYTSIYKLCQQFFEKNNLNPQKVFTLRSETIVSMMLTQDAIGLIPRESFNIFKNSGLTAVSLKPVLKIPIMIYVRDKINSEIVSKLIKKLRE